MVILLGLAAAALAAGCGSESHHSKQDPPPAPVGPQPEDATFKAECGRCHKPGGQAPRIESVAQARGTGAKGRIAANTMPPDKRLSADIKATLQGAL